MWHTKVLERDIGAFVCAGSIRRRGTVADCLNLVAFSADTAFMGFCAPDGHSIEIEIRLPQTEIANDTAGGPRPILDPSTVEQSTQEIDGQITGLFDGLVLRSAYQPVFSVAHKRVVGYEALARATEKGRPIAAEDLFSVRRSERDSVFLDRLARYIHVRNFVSLGDGENWLFLNIGPVTIIDGPEYGPFFSPLLERWGLPSERVVIEVAEYPLMEHDGTELSEAVGFYRDMGCLVALDDFGAGHSNFKRVWTLKPDIVKLARSMLTPSGLEKRGNVLHGIVGLLHQAGSLVVLEGVESIEEALVAMESGADFVQGRYFGSPSEKPLKSGEDGGRLFDPLLRVYKAKGAQKASQLQSILRDFQQVFEEVIGGLRRGRSLEEAVVPLFARKAVVRCFLLDGDGLQLGENIVSPHFSGITDPRFRPLDNAKEADWSRRSYVHRALRNPGQVQITRPYLSVAGAHMCRTLSLAFPSKEGERILCADIAHEM